MKIVNDFKNDILKHIDDFNKLYDKKLAHLEFMKEDIIQISKKNQSVIRGSRKLMLIILNFKTSKLLRI